MTPIDLDALEDQYEDDSARPRARSRPARRDAPTGPVGRVLGVDRGWVSVLLDGAVSSAVYGGAMRGEQLVAGDRVVVKPPRHESDEPRVVARLERDTVLTRTPDDSEEEERVVVANADRVVVVLAAEDPEGGARFVDRVLVAARIGGLEGAVCVNKVDLDHDVGDIAHRYAAVGYPVVRTSATTGEGIDDLHALLDGKWTVLSGHSGVGKSSLFNRLVPDADRRVGEIGRRGGRHTTVSSLALPVPGLTDTWLVDTPGVRTFGIGTVEPDDLAACFPELDALPCQLSTCLHDGEPGCVVPSRLRDGIHPARYASYLRLLAAARGQPVE